MGCAITRLVPTCDLRSHVSHLRFRGEKWESEISLDAPSAGALVRPLWRAAAPWLKPLRLPRAQLQTSFRKGATSFRALLRNLTYTDKASYLSTPHSTTLICLYATLYHSPLATTHHTPLIYRCICCRCLCACRCAVVCRVLVLQASIMYRCPLACIHHRAHVQICLLQMSLHMKRHRVKGRVFVHEEASCDRPP